MHVKHFYCFECWHTFPKNRVLFECPDCSGPLDIEYDYGEIRKNLKKKEFFQRPMNHWKYAEFLPVAKKEKIVSLNEGNTPLIPDVSEKNVFFKFEGLNPTGSFKDRGSTVEITKAMELGIKQVFCASTGNMGASIAAYSARAGIKATIVVPKIAEERKVRQMHAHGAEVRRINGDYTDALNIVRKKRAGKNAYLVGDYPFRGEGEKTVGYEIAEQLSWSSPEFIFCPMGNGTLIYAVFKAFKELEITGIVEKIPRLVGVQSEKCCPIVKAFSSGKEIAEVKNPETIATAIACGKPIDGLMALHALSESGGKAIAVREKGILAAQKELALQGIYAEPSGAACLAGMKETGTGKTSVLIVTGHGLKSRY